MKQLWTATWIAVALVLLAGLGTHARSAGEENKPAYPAEELTIDGKKPARFLHTIHAESGIACGICHHDAEHRELTAEAIAALENPVTLRCASCHNEEFAKEELRQKKEIFHRNCKECHKQPIDGKQGPTKCTGCHLSAK